MEVIGAIQILEILETNSIPIKILGTDADIYYAKTIFKIHPPLEDIINELIGNEVYKIWGIKVPEIKIIKIENKLLQEYLIANNIISKYSQFDIEELFIIGSKEIHNQTELDYHNLVLSNKNDFNQYLDPYKFLDIAFCDVWLANRDRRINNPNLLLVEDQGKIDFVAIDHTQLFGNQTNYKGLKINVMDVSLVNMLIASKFTKKICNFAENEVLSKFNSRIIEKINTTLVVLPEVLDSLPSKVGLSKAGKLKIIEILSNQERNTRISNILNKLLK
ncbi:HipA family kinase [Myroides odoratimimus]|uniref:HipA family kinase n=2 Tax=Myroides odoratimimus TaxID=76832 RepID=UPI002DB86BA9|nr:HipA family kinase [Myroides odoratimimus]MEC4094311.1 HipA family kinase [Myroides odoratimimus]